jgi:DNA mismatch repair protein MutL
MRAVRDGYESLLKHGYFPSGVINVDISPAHVDVNVHPQKSEVRFRNEGAVFSATKAAVNLALKNASSNVIEQKVYDLKAFSFDRQEICQEEIRFQGNGSIVHEAFLKPDESPYKNTNPELPNVVVEQFNKLKYFGQIFKLYLLFSDSEKFAVIDMHAAHERITFFKLKKEFLSHKKIMSEELLFPITLPLDFLVSKENIENKLDALSVLGIEAEMRNEEIVIRAISKMLSADKIKELISDILDKSSAEDFNIEILKKMDSYLSRLACHGSLRRGRELKPDEAYELIDQLNEADHSGWCPHGRPVIWWISEADLERQFGRIQ